MSIREGYIPFHGYQTWYQIVGQDTTSSKFPLICLHGGPGIPHDYLKSLEKVAETGRRVIFYDQLGCGNSACPNDDLPWGMELYKEELSTLLKVLNIRNYHLLGQSWGGALALEHALDQPKGLESLILASTFSSTPQLNDELARIRKELPQSIQDILDKHEKDGTTQSEEYNKAVMEFYSLYICRLHPWPEEGTQAFLKLSKPVYAKIWGTESEFKVTGNLKNWDIRNRLKEISLPTLITSGKYDEMTPLITRTLNEGILHSKWILFENSAHLSNMEEPERYITILNDFLDEVEKSNC